MLSGHFAVQNQWKYDKTSDWIAWNWLFCEHKIISKYMKTGWFDYTCWGLYQRRQFICIWKMRLECAELTWSCQEVNFNIGKFALRCKRQNIGGGGLLRFGLDGVCRSSLKSFWQKKVPIFRAFSEKIDPFLHNF